MTDDPHIRGRQDRQRINVNQGYEVGYWSERLGIRFDELRRRSKPSAQGRCGRTACTQETP